MQVFVFDPLIPNHIIIDKNCTPVDKEEGLKNADYISVHMPLNEKTRNF